MAHREDEEKIASTQPKIQPPFQASQETEQARQDALSYGGKRPGSYVSKWQQQLDAAMEKILNREKFSYDLNGDALYRQYKDQAVKNGRLAMMDTLGQSAGLTGGYGSSYGQTAAQQSYLKSMDSLSDKAGEFYDRALAEYDRQGQRDQADYELLRQRESGSRSQYDQDLAAWQKENDRLWQRYADLRQRDYNAYRDRITDDQWLAEFEEAQRKFNEELLHNKKYW